MNNLSQRNAKNFTTTGTNIDSTSSLQTQNVIQETKINLEETLSTLNHAYTLLREVENTTKGYLFRQDTLEYLFKKYPNMDIETFKNHFLQDTYNKNIFRNHPEIIDLLDFNTIQPGNDLIEILIEKISIDEISFMESISGKIDKITIPNMVTSDVAQGYFKDKLEECLPNTEIIFGDMPEIQQNLGYNQISADSVGFIDMLGNGHLNSCLFKLMQSPANQEKLKEINQIFSQVEKDIFIGGSTFVIPFDTPEDLEVVKMPKMEKNSQALELSKNGILLNSMGYLNSAYYSDKVKGSFVLGSHNIAEPMHAGKLTVINNDTENRYNHNWLISYFGEKIGLLMYTGSKLHNEEELNEFLSIDTSEVNKRNIKFKNVYKEKIIPLLYGILYRNLSKRFPDKIKAI